MHPDAGLMGRCHRGFLAAWLAVCAILVAAHPAAAQRPVRSRDAKAEGGGYAAHRLLQRGQELIESGEHERGTKIMETIIEQYPDDPIRFRAHLALGKQALARNEQSQAIGHLRALRPLDQPDGQMDEESRELFLESLYLQGIAFFQTRQYGEAFARLRRITNDFPNTVWANQSYYYIGMCHFAQGNWTKAIEALGLVGTFVDPDTAGLDRAEAGRRFYVKIRDTDLQVLEKLGQEVRVSVASASGDSEVITLVPLPGSDSVSIGSVATAMGPAIPGDEVLQVIGGDTIKTSYLDGNTLDGGRDVTRTSEVKVVSTAAVMFTRGDYESQAAAAFLGQPVFVVLFDADLDASPRADKATIRIISRFKEEESEETASTRAGVDIERMLRAEEETWRTRDEITLSLAELPAAAGGPEGQAAAAAADIVRTGRFGGRFQLGAFLEDQPVEKSDDVLTVAIGDEIVASFVDETSLASDGPRTATATIVVASEINSAPQVKQADVSDPVVAAKKNLVEAAAFLELGRIFKSMGLGKGAAEKVAEGLARVEPVVRQSANIPVAQVEEAFKAKWELHIVADDFEAAIRTCELFNRLYPASPLVDQALLQIGRINEEKKRFPDALRVYGRVLGLPSSQIKADAQFRIAQVNEKLHGAGSEQAIVQYKLCAERYPESPYAGESLGRLVDYHIEQKDYAAANDLLDQIFQDYPDAQFLDGMLLKWVMVAYRMGDYPKAYEKCSQLLFEYPESSFAEKARAILPKIEQKVKPAGGAGSEQQ